MAVSLVFAAALVAVASSNHLSSFGNQYSPLLAPAGPKPIYLFDESTPSLRLHQAPVHSRIAQEAAARLVTPQHNYVKHFNHIDAVPAQPNNIVSVKSPINPLYPLEQQVIAVHGRSAFDPHCPNCPIRVSPQSSEDAIAVQAALKNLVAPQSSLVAVIPEASQRNQFAKIAVLEDGTPVEVVPVDQPSVLAVNPQSPATKFITPLQAIAESQNAKPFELFLEDETPIAFAPNAKNFQPTQSPVLAVIPQDASVKFSNPQKYHAHYYNAQPSTYFLEDETPIAVIPAPAKTFQPAQPSVLAIPQGPSAVNQLYDAPATVVPLYHQNAHQAPAFAPAAKHYMCAAFPSFC